LRFFGFFADVSCSDSVSLCLFLFAISVSLRGSAIEAGEFESEEFWADFNFKPNRFHDGIRGAPPLAEVEGVISKGRGNKRGCQPTDA